ncbi:MAG: hypothetical protein A3F46_06565 [Legionellales bacterium RIFCSPHIGHO2_12_FULL_42_9]|nr:MAG: hypothetical protein A3F46_06565 [Legionellales bacterium RIFCSPHIGHO2_12_FULL_42_9]
MMRLQKKQEASAQEWMLTEGLYQGTFTAGITTTLPWPLNYSVVATSNSSLCVRLVRNVDAENIYYAQITINNSTYSPEILSSVFPDLNFDTKATLTVDESSNELTATGVFPFISAKEVTGSLKLTQELDGSISFKSALMGLSIFAKVKKQVRPVAAINELPIASSF